MTYQVAWSERSKKDLKALDRKVRERIIAKVESVKENPFNYIKRLEGVPLFSLRVGDYRVIMDVKSAQLLIFVVRAGHRGSVYDVL